MNNRRMLLGLGLGILLLTVNAGMAFVSIRALVEVNRRVAQAHRVLGQLEDTHSLLQAAEDEKRGINRDRPSPTPILDAVTHVVANLDELRAATSDNPRHQTRLERLKVLARDKLRDLKGPLESANGEVVPEPASGDPGRLAMAQIRELIDEMRTEERTHLVQHEERSQACLMGARSALVLSSLADFALVALACCLIRRDARIQQVSERSLRDYADALEAANRNLSRYCQAAEAATRAKSEFLANMSHEIRTPMMAILGHADLLLSGNLDEARRSSSVLAIQRNGNHLLQLINDILDLSKIEAGKLSIERTRCSPVDVLNDVRSMMEARAAGRKLSFQLGCDGLVPEFIQSDPTRLRQILINLVGNAIKFTERGSVRVICRFEPGTADRRPRLCFDVIDTGIGIEPGQLDHLFQPFAQADSSTTRRFGGSGLGLFISRHLAEALGGTIEAESTPGSGSRFTLSLDPGRLEGIALVDESQGTPLSRAKESEHLSSVEAALLRNRRVLLADDGVDNQYLISLHLRSAGMEVDVVDNGRLAVERAWQAILSERPYDLILMDMQMPELDGYSATQALRTDGYRGAILALTAHAMEGDREKCRAAGCDDYLSKPATRMSLLRTIAANLGRRSGARGGPAAPVDSRSAPAAGSQTERLVSSLVGDPRMSAAVDGFIGRLPRRIDALLEAAECGDDEALIREVHQLKGAAGGYGFVQLTDAAAALEQELKRLGERDDLDLPALRELIDLCRRAALPNAGTPAEREHAPDSPGG